MPVSTPKIQNAQRRRQDVVGALPPPRMRIKLGRHYEDYVAVAIWTLMLISVQPWTRADAGTGSASGSSSAGKGVLVALCLVVALAATLGPLRMQIPGTWWFYLAYAALAVIGAVLIGGVFAVGVRAVRIVAGFAVPLFMWPILRKDPARLIRAMFVGYLLLAILILLGPLARPSEAWLNGQSFSSGGRLMGAFLPMLPPRVGEVGAMTIGLSSIGWAHGRLSARSAVPVMAVGASLIYLSRTRTAALALVVGIVLCAAVTWRSRGGRRVIVSLIGTLAVLSPLIPYVVSWALRNQSSGQLTSLSGRTVAWDYILKLHVGIPQRLLGHGLGMTKVFIRRGDNTLNYAAIDNSWLSLYYESGLLGVALGIAAFIAAARAALRARTPYVRAVCVFLMSYLLVDGFNETGLSDLSSLSLILMVAAMSAYLDEPHGPTPGRPPTSRRD